MMQLTRIPGAIKVNHLNNAYWSTQRTTKGLCFYQKDVGSIPWCPKFSTQWIFTVRSNEITTTQSVNTKIILVLNWNWLLGLFWPACLLELNGHYNQVFVESADINKKKKQYAIAILNMYEQLICSENVVKSL